MEDITDAVDEGGGGDLRWSIVIESSEKDNDLKMECMTNTGTGSADEEIECQGHPSVSVPAKRKSDSMTAAGEDVPEERATSSGIGTMEPRQGELEFKALEMVWGKLKGYAWWPGIVCAKESLPDQRNIKWFGDGKQSSVKTKNLKHFKDFNEYFHRSSFNKMPLYRCAVLSAIAVDAHRVGQEFPPLKLKEQHEILVSWALDGFPPLAPGSLKQALMNIKKECREVNVNAVKEGEKQMKDFCLVCGNESVVTEHPYFEGGLCENCKVDFMETAFLYDVNGYRAFCAVCSENDELLQCGRTCCNQVFCSSCLDILVGHGTYQKELQNDSWTCFMCKQKCVNGFLRRRKDWRENLYQLMKSDDTCQTVTYMDEFQIIPVWQRRPIRVLSLFDGISPVLVSLKKLGIKVECYFATEVNPEAITVAAAHHSDAITFVGDVSEISWQNLEEWGPIDLLIANCQVSDIKLTATKKKRMKLLDQSNSALWPSVNRMFEFYRMYKILTENVNTNRPLFWLFESETDIIEEDLSTITRFLLDDPVTFDAEDVSAMNRTRYFWGNLPGMNRQSFHRMEQRQTVQDCLEPNLNRIAQVDQLQTIVTKSYAREVGKVHLPVKVGDEYDELWNIEFERLFGFPEHYADVDTLDEDVQQHLLCTAWSLPLVKRLLSPLKEYYACDV